MIVMIGAGMPSVTSGPDLYSPQTTVENNTRKERNETEVNKESITDMTRRTGGDGLAMTHTHA